MHCNYITLRALAVQLLLLIKASLHVNAEEPTTTRTITSTRVVSTHWVVISTSAGSLVTYTTSDLVTGSTIGTTTIAGTEVQSTQIAEPTPQSSVSAGVNMSWEGKSFKDAVLNSTNLYRTRHEASTVKWDDSLASFAQDHADGCDFEHSDRNDGSYGENLAQGYPGPAPAIDGWANEESDYDYEKREFSTEAGHFTQLVWKNTTAVGCGATDCGDDGWLFVCEYSPAGNVIGEFGGNVGKPGQGEDGEPGMSDESEDSEDTEEAEESGAVAKGIRGRFLVALVAMSVLLGLCA